ncbi:MAG: cytochrome c3 family protein [Acidobacteriia bacterium]|nr:cytochrome c3 family protein [Terriglobia bacterium]
MSQRTRTTKTLAKRIDLQYFARPHPFRRWRLWLSVGVPLIALGWVVGQRAEGGQKAYSSGPLAHSHAVFTQQCGLCHVARTGAFFAHVSDQACLTCHDAPVHQPEQTFTPQCSSCHVEHQGAIRLAATSDASCMQCHANLRTRDGQPHYAASIGGFDRQHPEFSVLAPGRTDPGRIKLNHYVHLQPNLMGPNNTRVEMSCDDCHRATGSGETWPYASTELHSAALKLTSQDLNQRGSKAPMVPPAFAWHCAACHTLQFDNRFGNAQVPHDKPEVVHAFLIKQFGEYIAAHPAAVHEVEASNRELPERARIPRVARNASEWVEFRVEDAEHLLWLKTCKQCHTLNFTGGPLPEVAKSSITARWLPHAEFDHQAHRAMACTACHTRAPNSRDTADILVPSIQICQQCHREQGPMKESAEGRCFECHQYHDWSKAKRTKGRFSIPELRGTARLRMPKN